MATAQAIAPFLWGRGGQAVTASQLERDRKINDALRAAQGYRPTGPWSTIGALAGEGVANYRDAQDSQAESEAQKTVADALANGRYQDVVASDFATPQQSAVAQALWQQDMLKNDPEHKLDLELKQAQLDAEKGPKKRDIQNDANGVPRFIDTGEPVYPTDISAGDHVPFNGDEAKGESNLRTEYNGINTVKDFGLQTQAYQRVLDSAKDPSAAGDLALIFNYMKVLDPGSTVREGEFATAQNSGGVPDQVISLYNKLINGERLAPDIRKDFVTRAGKLFKGASGLQENTNKRYSDLASHYGFDPTNIINPVPKIGVLDPQFNVDEYLKAAPDGTVQQTKPLPVTSDADYQAIPKGAQYVDPQGNVRVKQ